MNRWLAHTLTFTRVSYEYLFRAYSRTSAHVHKCTRIISDSWKLPNETFRLLEIIAAHIHNRDWCISV